MSRGEFRLEPPNRPEGDRPPLPESVPFTGPITGPITGVVRPAVEVYVGGPIDQTGVAGTAAMKRYLEVRGEVVQRLRRCGVRTYAAWEDTEPGSQAAEHRRIQAEALESCLVMVALLPRGVPTIGTPIELYRALARGAIGIEAGTTGSMTLEGLGQQFLGQLWHAPWNADDIAAATMRRLDEVNRGLGRRPEPEPVSAPSVVLAGDQSPLRFVCEDPRWLPRRHYPDDAGFDLWVSQSTVIPAGEWVDVPAGCSVQLPEACWGLIVGRSSTLRRRGLHVATGVIDPGWRGPLFVAASSPNNVQTAIQGERLGQLILMPNISQRYTPVQVDELDPHPRGHNGFGSTGV